MISLATLTALHPQPVDDPDIVTIGIEGMPQMLRIEVFGFVHGLEVPKVRGLDPDSAKINLRTGEIWWMLGAEALARGSLAPALVSKIAARSRR